jgi:hypothetical protein
MKSEARIKEARVQLGIFYGDDNMKSEARIKEARVQLGISISTAMDKFFEQVKDISPGEYYPDVMELLSENMMEDFYNWYDEEIRKANEG